MTGDDRDLPDVTPRDAIEMAQRALAKANRVDELEDQIDDLREQVTALELRLSEQDEGRPYEALTLDEKVGMVREHGFSKATAGTGYAKLDYDAIMWEVFDGSPGAKHCYKLMRKAGEARGFEFCDPSGESKHLRIDAAEAKRSAAFFPENKTSTEGVGE